MQKVIADKIPSSQEIFSLQPFMETKPSQEKVLKNIIEGSAHEEAGAQEIQSNNDQVHQGQSKSATAECNQLGRQQNSILN